MKFLQENPKEFPHMFKFAWILFSTHVSKEDGILILTILSPSSDFPSLKFPLKTTDEKYTLKWSESWKKIFTNIFLTFIKTKNYKIVLCMVNIFTVSNNRENQSFLFFLFSLLNQTQCCRQLDMALLTMYQVALSFP